MNHHSTVSFTRRKFLATLAAGGAGLALGGYMRSYGADEVAARQRRIWVCSDCHIGLAGKTNDGRDGADWLALAVAEQRKSQPRPDYVLALGDLTHNSGEAAQLKSYAAIRDAADMGPWFEIVGNHDFGGVARGDWQRIIGRPTHYTLVDGNTAFICASAEKGSAAGWLSNRTCEWMAGELDRCKGGNVVVCTHQPPADTVYRSDQGARCLGNEEAVARLIEQHRIDLWLCGHIHAGPRTPEYVVRHGRTTFVNVAAAGHAYTTGAATSYTFTGADGSRSLVGRCRDHERNQFLDDQEVNLDLPKPWALGAKPVLLPANLPASSQPDDDAAVFAAESAFG